MPGLTVSPTKSYDLSTSSKWTDLAIGNHNITIVAKADGYRDSDPSIAVSFTKQNGGEVMSKLTKGTWRWLTPYTFEYDQLKELKNNTTVTEFTSGGKTFIGFDYDPITGSVSYSSDTEHVDVIVGGGDDYVNETYKDITTTQDFDLEEDDFLYAAINSKLLTKLS